MNRLEDLRKEYNISKKELAKYLNITKDEYEKYETNELELNAEILKKLARYYNTSIDYILLETDEFLRH